MPTISYHIFMFPFSLDKDWKQADIDRMLKTAGWERNQFFYNKGDYASNFSEQGYFYDFSSGAMFDDPTSQNRSMTTYAYPVRGSGTYTININKKGERKSYTLTVEKIELNVYDEKAAVLSFHLDNDKYSEIQDILFINDYGRRIYPEYLANDQNGQIDLQITKNSFLADSICLSLANRPPFEDDFAAYARETIPPYFLPRYIKALLPEAMHNCRWLLDDRMYVISYYSNEGFSHDMKTPGDADTKLLSKGRAEWWWYQYVFVDNDDPTCQDEEMIRDLLKKATYARWRNYGTFYGVSRHSFVALIGNDIINLLRHMKTIYYRMASLVVAQRVLSLFYSREISEISRDLDERKLSNRELRKRVNALNRDYLRFVNNIYFREVTSQDQGIELYDLMQEQMNIKRDEEGLSTEVEQLYHYVTMANDEQRNDEAEKLSIIATFFLVPTLITGIWGMNLGEGHNIITIFICLSVFVVVIALFIIARLFRKKE